MCGPDEEWDVGRKAKPQAKRRRPCFATMVCAGLTLAVAVNIALRDEPRRVPSGQQGESVSGEVVGAAVDAPAPDRKLIVAIQRELEAKGYAPGNEEGDLTLATRAAVLAFETDTGRPLTGVPSEAILKELLFGAAIAAKGPEAPKLTAEGTRLVREIEARLESAGFDPGAVDGRLDTRTANAIKRFEAAHGLKVTGRIGGRLAGRLLRAAAS